MNDDMARHSARNPGADIGRMILLLKMCTMRQPSKGAPDAAASGAKLQPRTEYGPAGCARPNVRRAA